MRTDYKTLASAVDTSAGATSEVLGLKDMVHVSIQAKMTAANIVGDLIYEVSNNGTDFETLDSVDATSVANFSHMWLDKNAPYGSARVRFVGTTDAGGLLDVSVVIKGDQ
jgi:hypothetical protein